MLQLWFFKKEGRATYLEFLRNLTPQILLFAAIMIIGEKMMRQPPESCAWYGIGVFVLVLFAIMWILAFAANGSLLYDKALASRSDIEEHKSMLKEGGLKGGKLAWASFKYTAGNHRLLVAEVVIIIFVIYGSTILAMMSGVITALGFLKNVK
ncbi:MULTISPECIES: hypothetical protein [unclassified Pseudomonas]|uniref:hypothetical protein n=1 Tax=unclassified Pseudomonas TaxID=196821 RepID=UPI000C884DD7|nr:MULTISPECIES: hypothetical protein [unclassified Pseudomonas]PNA04009.1 hypothetical protein C1X28_17475 [Pseudomonas sp. FW305-BF15]PNB79040.1 hypothetical protein C1X30_20625 [Pseudomonas sp. FW305-BF6]